MMSERVIDQGFHKRTLDDAAYFGAAPFIVTFEYTQEPRYGLSVPQPACPHAHLFEKEFGIDFERCVIQRSDFWHGCHKTQQPALDRSHGDPGSL